MFTGWSDQGPTIDVAVHLGTLGAVVIYFWRDLVSMLVGLGRFSRGLRDPGRRLAINLAVATIPVFAAGFLLERYMGGGPRGLLIIAWTTFVFGIVLFITDKLGMTIRRLEHLTAGDALVIGLAQVLALIPGTSRSGITISAARMLGLERTEAARFSMLLSIPAILGAGALKGWELYQSGDPQLTLDAVLATALAFVAGIAALAVMMSWLRRATFTPFVVYRLLLGGGLLAMAYGWLA